MHTINVLQFGPDNFSKQYELYGGCVWHYETEVDFEKPFVYDMVILDRAITEEEKLYIYKAVRPYRMFYLDDIEQNEDTEWIIKSRMAKPIRRAELDTFLVEMPRLYFSYAYGEKYDPRDISIAQGFEGSIKWNGYTGIVLEGNFGHELSQVAYWRINLPLDHTAVEFWLEYKKQGDIEISLEVTLFVSGSISEIQEQWEFSEEELENVVWCHNKGNKGSFFVSLKAKGKGTLEIIALHDRHSREGQGNFLPGGDRYVTSDREEVFFYFDPMDMKPPLNIYFSGYKTMEGYEGTHMFERMDSPYLLISESRLEGGGFYLGSPEYERLIEEKIRYYMDYLGFTREQVNMSGLSMGTFGAMYYGSKIMPHAILLGKPLASLGDIADNERVSRPGGFPTSLDVIWKNYESIDKEDLVSANDRFWNQFDRADWGKTKFAVAYMIEDDYDGTAYRQLLEHLVSDGVTVYGKGLHGRHNDDTPGIVGWFKNQYDSIMRNDFGRKR